MQYMVPIFDLCRAIRAVEKIPGFDTDLIMQEAHTRLMQKLTEHCDRINLDVDEYLWNWFDKDNFQPMVRRRADAVTVHKTRGGKFDALAPTGYEVHDFIGNDTHEEALKMAGVIKFAAESSFGWDGPAPIFDYTTSNLIELEAGSGVTTWDPYRFRPEKKAVATSEIAPE